MKKSCIFTIFFFAFILFSFGCNTDSEALDGDSENNSDGDLDNESDSFEDESEPEIETEPEEEIELVNSDLTITINTDNVKIVDERFLSFAVDSSQAAGGNWWSEDANNQGSVGSEKVDPYDFSRPRLRKLIGALSPAYLRIGGSEADNLYYDMSDNPVTEAPEPYSLVYTKEMFDNVNSFVIDLGLRLMFTVNAGPGPRNESKRWTADNARELVKYASSKNYPVDIWELGNEINGYALFHGLDWVMTGEGYATDVDTFNAMINEEAPNAKTAGPSSAYWPINGEPLPFMEEFMPIGGNKLDIITWHYYPQQSRRCPLQTVPATKELLMQPDGLNEVQNWAEHVEELTSQYAPNADIWLGETGNAQCGGEPGVSDTFRAGFWWLDQLGTIAARGQQVVVRQCVSGSTYALMDNTTLTPWPDYWNSVLWKRLMGNKVLKVSVPEKESMIRAYSHCTPEIDETGYSKGAVTALILNLDQNKETTVSISGTAGNLRDIYLVTTTDPGSRDLYINQTLMQAEEDGSLPDFNARQINDPVNQPYVTLPPASYAFVVFKEANATVCK